MKLIKVLLLAVILGLLGCGSDNSYSGNSGAATGADVPFDAEVTMGQRNFVPQTLTIEAGETVRWTNKSAVSHTVTSQDNLFDSGTIRPGGIFSYTFSTPGQYQYVCTIHAGMAGTVIVR